MQAEGSFGVCGKIAPGKLYVAEGYATCASIYAATKTNTIFALSAETYPKYVRKEAFPGLNWWLQQITTRLVSRRQKLRVGHTPRPKARV